MPTPAGHTRTMAPRTSAQNGEGPMTRIVIIGGGPAGYEAALVAAQLGARGHRHRAGRPRRRQRAHRLRAVEDAHRRRRDHVLGARLRRPRPQGRGAVDRAPRPRHGQPPGQGAGDGPVRRHPAAAAGRGRARSRRHGPALRRDPRARRAPGRGPRRRRRRSPRRWRPTSSSSRPAPTPACCPAPSRTASGSSTGATSTSSTRCPSTSSSSAPGSPAPSSPPATSRPACPSRSSPRRDQVLPGEDSDAAAVVEQVFTARGGRIAERSRAAAVRRTEKGVVVELTDGRTVEGSHALMTVGTVPNTAGLNLEQCGVERQGVRAHRRRPGLPDVGVGHLRRRRRHRRLPAGLGRGDAGPDRDVARARRGGHPDPAEDRRRQRLHPPGDRHRRRAGEVDARATWPSTSSNCPWPPTRGPR